MLCIFRTSFAINEEVLTKAGTKRRLINDIRKRPSEFLGHIIRKGQLEHLSITGKIRENKARGPQIINYIQYQVYRNG